MTIITASGQQDSIRPPVPVVDNIKIYTLLHSLPPMPSDIAKSPLTSYQVYAPKIMSKRIERKYFADNVFDIGEYDNPFALQRHTSRQKSSDISSSKQQVPISELFVLNDADSGTIPQWLIFFLLGVLSFMTILLSLYRRTIGNIFQAFFSLGAASNLYREQRSYIKIESFSSYILFVLTMGAFCFLLVQILGGTEQTFNTFGALMLCVVGVGLLYLGRYVLLWLTSAILPYPNEISFYSFVISITNKIIGYLLVPILFLLAYVPEASQLYVLYTAFVLLGVIYIYRSIRGLSIASDALLFHKFHFFIYLCTIEIAPMLILLKTLSII